MERRRTAYPSNCLLFLFQAAKLTQRNHRTFDQQTAKRLTEFRTIKLAVAEISQGRMVWEYFDYVGDGDVVDAKLLTWEDIDKQVEVMESQAEDRDEEQSNEDDAIHTGGTELRLAVNKEQNNRRYFKVLGRSNYKDSTVWETQVVNFLHDLQDLVLPYIPSHHLPVFTEHKRNSVTFRGHPNYSGSGKWNDWAIFDWGEEGEIPCRIWCFVKLFSMPKGRSRLQFGGIDLTDGVFVVVETAQYVEDQREKDLSDILIPITMLTKSITNGKVSGRMFYLADTNAIVDPCCVIPDEGGEVNAFFQVKNRTKWSQMFQDWVNRPHREDDEVLESDTEDEEEEYDDDDEEELDVDQDDVDEDEEEEVTDDEEDEHPDSSDEDTEE